MDAMPVAAVVLDSTPHISPLWARFACACAAQLKDDDLAKSCLANGAILPPPPTVVRDLHATAPRHPLLP